MKKLLLLLALATAPLSGQVLDTEAAAAQQAVQTLHMAAEGRIAADQQAIADANAKTLAAQQALDAANAQISTLQTAAKVFTYRDLEYMSWPVNTAAQVGGSGLGTAAQSPATGPGTASFSLAPVAGNYFDAYWHLDFAPDDSRKTFTLTQQWMFPTAADAAASQALEMEIRPVTAAHLMGACALQMEFSGHQLRIFDHVRKWFNAGVAMPRLTPGVWYTVTLECHRDDVSIFYDAISINGTRYPLTYSYPLWNQGWRQMMRVAEQLDGNGAGTAYTVKRGPGVFTSTN